MAYLFTSIDLVDFFNILPFATAGVYFTLDLDPMNPVDYNDFSYSNESDSKLLGGYFLNCVLENYKLNMEGNMGEDYSNYTWEDLHGGLGGPLPPNSLVVPYTDRSDTMESDNNQLLSDPLESDNNVNKNLGTAPTEEEINFLESMRRAISSHIKHNFNKIFNKDGHRPVGIFKVSLGQKYTTNVFDFAHSKGCIPIYELSGDNFKFNLYSMQGKFFAHGMYKGTNTLFSFHDINATGDFFQILGRLEQLKVEGDGVKGSRFDSEIKSPII